MKDSAILKDIIESVAENVPSLSARSRIYQDLIESYSSLDLNADDLMDCVGIDIVFDKLVENRD